MLIEVLLGLVASVAVAAPEVLLLQVLVQLSLRLEIHRVLACVADMVVGRGLQVLQLVDISCKDTLAGVAPLMVPGRAAVGKDSGAGVEVSRAQPAPEVAIHGLDVSSVKVHHRGDLVGEAVLRVRRYGLRGERSESRVSSRSEW